MLNSRAQQLYSLTHGGSGGGGASSKDFATVTFMNGGAVHYSRPVYKGDDCPNPVSQGRVGKPTKESTESLSYTYIGWSATDGGSASSAALQKITEDKTLYAAYTSAARKYTVTYCDTDGTVLKTESLAYGTTPAYEPTKEGLFLEGWEPALSPVTGDASYTAVWGTKISFADATWADINGVCEAGDAAKHFTVGETKTITEGDYTYTARIIGINLDDKADSSGKAGITVILEPATDTMAFADVRAYLGNNTLSSGLTTIFGSRLPSNLTNVIKPVTKITDYRADSGKQSSTTTETLFLLSAHEVASTGVAASGILGTAEVIKYPGVYSTDAYAVSRKFTNAAGSTVAWWTRSRYAGGRMVLCMGSGEVTYTAAPSYDVHVLPCFCI